jgi:hypothetical protein
LHTGHALSACGGTGRIAGVLENICEIDETVALKVRIEREAEKASIA